jgi:hypothetical protein
MRERGREAESLKHTHFAFIRGRKKKGRVITPFPLSLNTPLHHA